MNKIPHERAILYLLLLGFIPFFFVWCNYTYQKEAQIACSAELSSSISQAANLNQKELYNKRVRKLYTDKDHFYLAKQLETLKPLSVEIDALKKAIGLGFHPDRDILERRLQLLTGNENSIAFQEGSPKTYSSFHETVESLAHPIEVDLDDLGKILNRIEEPTPGEESTRPHLIITDFRIDKKKGPINDTFLLNLKVLKREYTK